MLYLMLIYQDDARMAAATPEEQAAIGEGYGKLNTFLAESGASRGTAAWPANITTLRSVDGMARTAEGPAVETGERVAGFFLVEAEDKDAAIRIAERVPGTQFGAVEIRPVQA